MAQNPGSVPPGQEADENFGEEDDELDIFAESNKQEPMRNPILGKQNIAQTEGQNPLLENVVPASRTP